MNLKDVFFEGAELFNEYLYNDAHIKFEQVWKHGGELERSEIKGFIQLTGAILNTNSTKISSGKYLFKKSLSNISSTSHILEWINIELLSISISECLEQLEDNPQEFLPKIKIIFR